MWVDHFGRTMRPIWLESRNGIWETVAGVEPVFITRSRPKATRHAGKIAILVLGKLYGRGFILEYHLDFSTPWRPDSEMDSLGVHLGSGRITSPTVTFAH